jgi:NAD(P)-dependent dehydrogenase (short-subunit alcohol dehydrogenase family)
MIGANAVVTGGSGGIGVETAVLLAEQGVSTIIINGRDSGRGERARAEILRRAPTASVHFIAADVSRAQGAHELFRTVASLIDGPLAVLVNGGGGDFAPELFQQIPGDQLDDIIRHWLSRAHIASQLLDASVPLCRGGRARCPQAAGPPPLQAVAMPAASRGRLPHLPSERQNRTRGFGSPEYGSIQTTP